MKPLFVAFIVIVFLNSCSKSATRVAELEETVKLQAQEIEQLKAAQTVRAEEDALASEFRAKRKACSKVKISGDTARIYFCGMMDTVFFLENPEPQSRHDLDFFLKRTGFETGVIEYYTPQGEKIFSITGDLSRVETHRYH